MIKYKQGTLTNQRFLAKIQDKFWFCRWNSRVNDGIFANSSVVTIFFFYKGVSIKGLYLFSRVPSKSFFKNVWVMKCGIQFEALFNIEKHWPSLWYIWTVRGYRDTPWLLKTDLPADFISQTKSFHLHVILFGKESNFFFSTARNWKRTLPEH